MYIKSAAVAAILLASFVRAQETFDFTSKPSPQGLQEVATILKTVADIQNSFIHPAAQAIAISGTPDELATAGWIISQLDRPAPANPSTPGPNARSEQYAMPGKTDDIIRIFHPNPVTSKTPQQMQDILSDLHAVSDIQKIFSGTALPALVLRGTSNALALADYIIEAVSATPGTPVVAASPEFRHAEIGRASDLIRVFYLANTRTPPQMQEILTALRTVASIPRGYMYTPLNALVIRGDTPGDLAASEFVVRALDLAPGAKGLPPAEFKIPANVTDGDVIGVYYTSNFSADRLTETAALLRDNLQLTKTFVKTTPAALIYRGTADQIAKAEHLIKQKDQPEESSAAATAAHPR